MGHIPNIVVHILLYQNHLNLRLLQETDFFFILFGRFSDQVYTVDTNVNVLLCFRFVFVVFSFCFCGKVAQKQRFEFTIRVSVEITPFVAQ